MAGYSSTPLIRKLGFNAPLSVLAVAAPREYVGWLGGLPEGVRIVSRATKPIRAAHVFVTRSAELRRQLAALRGRLAPDGFVWVSWPKKASKVDTDVTEDTIRAIALPLGFVDVKVCAVSDVWSGLKLVIRKSERAA